LALGGEITGKHAAKIRNLSVNPAFLSFEALNGCVDNRVREFWGRHVVVRFPLSHSGTILFWAENEL
jgi:hypothetical protein